MQEGGKDLHHQNREKIPHFIHPAEEVIEKSEGSWNIRDAIP